MEKVLLDSLAVILEHFLPDGVLIKVQKYGSGHINNTFFCIIHTKGQDRRFILQRINTNIFKDPVGLMNNIAIVNTHLSRKPFPQQVLHTVSDNTGNPLYLDSTGAHWRLFPFIEQSKSFNTAPSIAIAEEAARTFGQYLYFLADLDLHDLIETIPDFHNIVLRFRRFSRVLEENVRDRAKTCKDTIEKIQYFQSIGTQMERLELPLRLTHNDTKINNVLFHKESLKGICVVDLDTLMPGTWLFDYGDMVRTFVPTVSEEEPDSKKVELRLDYFEAMTKGFLKALGPKLASIEREYLLFGAKAIIFEQALRFLTDFLKGDVYYPVKYQAQNLNRAKNQLVLLEQLYKHEEVMNHMIEKY